MNTLAAYLPQDRRGALSNSQTLPEYTSGSALFADISGFTPLTEQLTQTFGARRGIEELTRRINAVYEALIGSVERWGGSVISFAGDAITCWFDDTQGSSSTRAATAAQEMQKAMVAVEGLALKVAVTTGAARRFVVGDPTILRIDALAGATVARLATAEHLAKRGEILLDEVTAGMLSTGLGVKEWRTTEDGERFAVLEMLHMTLAPVVAPTQTVEVALETLKPWVLPAVYEREQSGYGAFLTELRPAVALFVGFSGIDYDGDEQAEDKLDAVVRRAQQIVDSGDGTLLQLTIGDKGSYFYANFGAPVAHEDDVRRAVGAALALRRLPDELPFLQPVQIGLSSGTMRTGAYGGHTRLTYGALGDEVNLAARLMTSAAPGEILVSEHVQKAVADRFTLEPRPSPPMRGKAEPQVVFAVTGAYQQRAIKLEEPRYALPMLGRELELAVIGGKLKLASEGHGQVIGITADAGMGKSRLVAEVIRAAQRLGFIGYGGACESSGTNSAYLVWKTIWQAFFDVDPTVPLRRQIRHLEAEIEDRAPHRLQAVPLLAPLLDLIIEDNDFTRTLEPKDRRNALEALLEDCLKAAAKEQPVLLVLEDMHWIDPLSHDLLDSLARATANVAVCFALAYRPPETARSQAPRVEGMPSFTRVPLDKLARIEVEQLIGAKLAQWFPERSGGLPQALVSQVTNRAEGNPFYVEELLNYLRDRGINPYDAAALSALELPNNLHALILSRIDQLTETQKATLKVASIIGRLFQVAWLRGYYPSVGTLERIKTDLGELARLDITPLGTPEPELAYLFKHIVTQEVAYESLPYATRAQLHERLAQFIEGLGADRFLDLLAFHYGRSENIAKQREYFGKAGEAATAAFANESALDYYARLLPLVSEPAEQADLHLRRAAVLDLMADWNSAEAAYRSALASAEQSRDLRALASAQYALADLSERHDDPEAGLAWLERARTTWRDLGEPVEALRGYGLLGYLLFRRDEIVNAKSVIAEGLARARASQNKPALARFLLDSASVYRYLGDYAQAAEWFEESLALQRESGDKQAIASLLGNLGTVAMTQGNHGVARTLLQESLAIRGQIGDKRGVAIGLGNLGYCALAEGDNVAAYDWTEQSLNLFREIGHKLGMVWVLENLALASLAQGDSEAARRFLREGLLLSPKIGQKRRTMDYLIVFSGTLVAQPGQAVKAAQLAGAAKALQTATESEIDPVERGVYERTIAAARTTLGEEAFNAAFEAGKQMSLDEAVQLALGEE